MSTDLRSRLSIVASGVTFVAIDHSLRRNDLDDLLDELGLLLRIICHVHLRSGSFSRAGRLPESRRRRFDPR